MEKKYTAADLQEAFLEGFEAGADHNDLPYRYPPSHLAWLLSETRTLKTNRTTPEKVAGLLKAWYEARIDDQPKIAAEVELENLKE